MIPYVKSTKRTRKVKAKHSFGNFLQTTNMSSTEILKIFCDGGARGNPGPGAIGVVIKTEDGKIIHRFGKRIGVVTNNQAEYTAVLEAISWVAENKGAQASLPTKIIFYLDSQLVAAQLNGIYKLKNANLRALLIQVREKEAGIAANISYHHIPRERNSEADALVNQALDA